MQSLGKSSTRVKDIDEIRKHPFPFAHPEDIDLYDTVHTFSAVIGQNKKIINAQDYISYKDSGIVS